MVKERVSIKGGKFTGVLNGAGEPTTRLVLDSPNPANEIGGGDTEFTSVRVVLNQTGTKEVPIYAYAKINGDVKFKAATKLHIAGKLDWVGGDITVDGEKTKIIVEPPGTWDILSDKTLTGIGRKEGTPQIEVYGKLNKRRTVGTTLFKDTEFLLGTKPGLIHKGKKREDVPDGMKPVAEVTEFNLLAGRVEFVDTKVKLAAGWTSLLGGSLKSNKVVTLEKAWFTGTGTVDAALENKSGAVIPGQVGAGHLVVKKYTQEAKGKLWIFVNANPQAGVEDALIAALDVTEKLTLDGALWVSWLKQGQNPNAVPRQFLTWGSIDAVKDKFSGTPDIRPEFWETDGNNRMWLAEKGVAGTAAPDPNSYYLKNVPWVAPPKKAEGGVFLDNGNGLRQPGERGLAGIPVNLLSPGGVILASTTTADDGTYSFAVEDGQSYRIQVVPPTGYGGFTLQHAGTDPALDSDVNGSGLSDLFTVSTDPEGPDTVLDAGLLSPSGTGSISGRVSLDLNGDGIRQAFEEGEEGVPVELIDTLTGQVVASTVTNASGDYLFYGVAPGTYKVAYRGIDPDYVAFSPKNVGDPSTDSDADAEGLSDALFLLYGDLWANIDAGLVSLMPAWDHGFVSGLVFNDADGDGLREDGEGMLGGIPVNLLDGSGALVETTTTADDGSYWFAASPGTYRVQVVPPTGYGAFTVLHAGTDPTIDSDVAPDGMSAPFTIGDGTDYYDLDAGIKPPQGKGTITGRAWWDDNGNGIQQPGEQGVPGVFVDLINAQTGQVVATVRTKSNGDYLFYGVAPGNYLVRFRLVDLDAVFTLKDQGGDDTKDSDANSTGFTDVFVEMAGALKKNLDVGLRFGTARRLAPAARDAAWRVRCRLPEPSGVLQRASLWDGRGSAPSVGQASSLPRTVGKLEAFPTEEADRITPVGPCSLRRVFLYLPDLGYGRLPGPPAARNRCMQRDHIR